MKCKKCQATIPEGALFCSSCGARADGNKPCPSCDKLIPDESVFCIFCGERVDGNKICSKCLKPVPAKAIFCTHCRARLDEKQICAKCGEEFDGDFCPMCGTPYRQTEEISATKTQTIKEPVIEPIITPIPVVVPAIESVKKNVIKPIEEVSSNEEEIISKDNYQEVENVEQEAEIDASNEVVNAIVCTQCGSSNVTLIAEDLAICKNCGTNIVINVEKETPIVNNTVNINMESSFGETPISFYALPKLHDSKYFLTRALEKLASDDETPEDIISNSEFAPVKTVYCNYVIGKGTAELTYSATVGYDYKVKYTDYDSSGRPVQKTKTETKWEPFSGNHVGDYVKAISNDEAETSNPSGYKFLVERVDEAVEMSLVDFETPTPNAPTQQSISDVKDAILYAGRYDCEKALPGNRHKQFNCNGTVKLHSLECHVAPQHVLTYKYNGEERKLHAHTFSSCCVEGDIVNAKKETTNEIEEKIKLYNIATCSFMFVTILCLLLVKSVLFISLMGGLSVAGFIALEVFRSITKKNVYAQKKKSKITSLIKALKERNLPIPDSVLEQAEVKEGNEND